MPEDLVIEIDRPLRAWIFTSENNRTVAYTETSDGVHDLANVTLSDKTLRYWAKVAGYVKAEPNG